MEKTTRIKMYVQSITKEKFGSEEQHKIRLSVVSSGSEENKSFFKYTPSGSLEFGVLRPEATEPFELGREFYVDFIPTEQ